MNKILKYKKMIVVCCLLCFSVVGFQKPKQANAEVITLTTGTILACAALATSVGFIITNSDMIEDVGRKVYDSIKDIPGAIEQFENKVKVNLAVGVLDAVINACNSLPKEPTLIDKIGDKIFNTQTYTNSQSFKNLGMTSAQGVINVTALDSGYVNSEGYTWLGINIRGYAQNWIKAKPGETFDIIYDLSNYSKDGRIRMDINGESYDKGFSGVISISTPIETILSYLSISYSQNNAPSYKYRVNHVYSVESIDIPYSEENGKNVSADVSKEYFPSGSGSISVPMDKPLTGYNPSISAPITKPSDLSIDGDIVIDSDTVTDDTVTDDTTGDNVGDNVGDNTGVWDWLKSLINSIIDLLKSIVNGITGIFEYLGSFISNLVKALVDAFTGMLEKLFVPTVAVDELFKVPSDSGFGKIVDFFSWDKLWNITPQPYKFQTVMPIYDLTGNGNNKDWNIEINLFDNKIVKDNINIVRNVLSYSILISSVWFVINHFLPKREMD